MLQTAHIINILNLVDKDYNNAQIFWALPFQVIYEKVKNFIVSNQFYKHAFFLMAKIDENEIYASQKNWLPK